MVNRAVQKSAPKVEVVVKKVGDEPYVTQLFYAGITPTSGIQRWETDKEAASFLVGGKPEWVHLGGKVYACVNGNGLLRDLPYNSCGFVGDFFFASLLDSGKVGVMSERDKRRVFKWYEANKHRPPPQPKPSEQAVPSLEEFQQQSAFTHEECERRNLEWKQL